MHGTQNAHHAIGVMDIALFLIIEVELDKIAYMMYMMMPIPQKSISFP